MIHQACRHLTSCHEPPVLRASHRIQHRHPGVSQWNNAGNSCTTGGRERRRRSRMRGGVEEEEEEEGRRRRESR